MILLFISLSIYSILRYWVGSKGTDVKVSIRMNNNNKFPSADKDKAVAWENVTSSSSSMNTVYYKSAATSDYVYIKADRHYCEEGEDSETMNANYIALSIIVGVLSIVSYDIHRKGSRKSDTVSNLHFSNHQLLQQGTDQSFHGVQLRLTDHQILLLQDSSSEEGRINCNTQAETLIEKYSLDIEELKDDYDSQQQDTLNDYDRQVKELVNMTQSLLNELSTRQEEELRQLQSEHNAQTGELSHDYKQRLEAIKSNHKLQVGRLTDTESSTMDKIAAEYELMIGETQKNDMLDAEHASQAKALLDYVIQRHLEAIERSISGLLALQKHKVEEDSEASLTALELQYKVEIRRLMDKHASEFNKTLEDQRQRRDDLADSNNRRQIELAAKRDAQQREMETGYHRMLADRSQQLKEQLLQTAVDQLRQDLDRRNDGAECLETDERQWKELADYKHQMKAEQELWSTKLVEKEAVVDALEKEKLDLLLALKDREATVARLEGELQQLSETKMSMIADLSDQVSELTRAKQALSEELDLAKSSLEEATKDRELAYRDLSVAVNTGLQKEAVLEAQCGDLRNEIAVLTSNLTKAKIKIVQLLKTQPISSTPITPAIQ